MYFESLNEIFANENVKKNCLPIDVNKTYDNARIFCLDYNLISEFQKSKNFQNFITSAKYSFIVVVISYIIVSILTLSISGLYLIPFLTILYSTPSFANMMVYLLVNKLYCAKEFFLFPIINDVENYDTIMIENEQENFIKHPVLSINNGKVIYVYDEIKNGEKYNALKHKEQGNTIIISHNDGEFYSLYAHMYNGIKVKIRDKVTKGQCIGYVGNTGASKYPHLHFEIFYAVGTKNTKIKLTKSLTNFEDYMYTPIDLEKELKVLSGKKSDKNNLNNPLIKNTSGKIDDCCFLT